MVTCFCTLTKSQLSDCPILKLSDLGSESSFSQKGLLASSFIKIPHRSQYYWILNFNIICLSQGFEKFHYSSTSAIIAYFVKVNNQTSHKIGLFHFRCISHNWALNLITSIDKDIATSILNQYFNHTVKKMCWMCTELIKPDTLNVNSHCIGKLNTL